MHYHVTIPPLDCPLLRLETFFYTHASQSGSNMKGLCAGCRMRSNALQNDLLRAPFAAGQKLLFRAAQGLRSERTLHRTPVRAAKRGKGGESGGGRSSGPLYITVERDGSDLWRLDPVINMLKEGAVSPWSPMHVSSPMPAFDHGVEDWYCIARK